MGHFSKFRLPPLCRKMIRLLLPTYLYISNTLSHCFYRFSFTCTDTWLCCTVDLQKLSVPQNWFCHFYALAVVWTTFLLLATWFYAHNMAPLVSEPFQYSSIATYLTGASSVFSSHESRSSALKHRYRVWQSVFLLLLMEVQALRRLYETIHTFKYSPSARMHIFGYLAGLL